MNRLLIVCALAGSMCGGQVWAINKCTGPDGKAVFQDRPCEGKGQKIEVRPASGHAPVPSPTVEGKPKMSEADRLNALTDESQRDRRRWLLREDLLPSAQAAQVQHRFQCEQTQRRLADEQHRYVQNLYGKVHAAQTASEMAAAAAMCDTKSRELREKTDALTSECTAMDCLKR